MAVPSEPHASDEPLVEVSAAHEALPIADALSDLEAADSLHERRDRVVECFRAAIRYLGAVVLSVRAQYGAGPGNEPDQKKISRQKRSLPSQKRRGGNSSTGGWFPCLPE